MKRFVVGLTGGIGSGKSTVALIFAGHGIDIIDADEASRVVVEPGSAALSQIAAHFGSEVLDEAGALRRDRLRELVFSNADERLWLESLLHPLIATHIRASLSASRSPYCILMSPLLLETDQVSLVDRVLVVDASEASQLQRTVERDGSTEDTIRAIMAVQMDRSERLRRADDVIDNDGDLSKLAEQVDSLHQQYLSAASQHERHE